MGAVFVFSLLSVLEGLFLGFLVMIMLEEEFNLSIFFSCISLSALIILCNFLSYFVGVNKDSYYCKECGYKTQNENIQYCPNDGTKLEFFCHNTD